LETLDRPAASYPLNHAKSNAAPVQEIGLSFSLTALVEIKRFSHVHRLKALIPSDRT
jgi:hypothetical protein